MSNSFYDNLVRATDNTSNISVEKYATVTLINDDNSVSCLEEDTDLTHDHVPVLNGLGLKLGDRVVLGFVDNSVYNPFVVGVLGHVDFPGGSGAYVDGEILVFTGGARVEGEELIL